MLLVSLIYANFVNVCFNYTIIYLLCQLLLANRQKIFLFIYPLRLLYSINEFVSTNFGAACRIRTDDLPLTRRMLWPTELKRHDCSVRLFSVCVNNFFLNKIANLFKCVRRRDAYAEQVPIVIKVEDSVQLTNV